VAEVHCSDGDECIEPLEAANLCALGTEEARILQQCGRRERAQEQGIDASDSGPDKCPLNEHLIVEGGKESPTQHASDEDQEPGTGLVGIAVLRVENELVTGHNFCLASLNLNPAFAETNSFVFLSVFTP
jgi:hypothetical protein